MPWVDADLRDNFHCSFLEISVPIDNELRNTERVNRKTCAKEFQTEGFTCGTTSGINSKCQYVSPLLF